MRYKIWRHQLLTPSLFLPTLPWGLRSVSPHARSSSNTVTILYTKIEGGGCPSYWGKRLGDGDGGDGGGEGTSYNNLIGKDNNNDLYFLLWQMWLSLFHDTQLVTVNQSSSTVWWWPAYYLSRRDILRLRFLYRVYNLILCATPFRNSSMVFLSFT